MVPGTWLAELASFFGQLRGRALPLVEALGVGPVNVGLENAVEGGRGVAWACPAAVPVGADDGHSRVGLAGGFVGWGEVQGEAGLGHGRSPGC